MDRILQRFLILVGCNILYTGANISLTTIGVLSKSDISLCNTTKTFMCRIDSYQLMIWSIDGITVAGCSSSLCDSYSTLPSNAEFKYNTGAGIFNLTFSQVKLIDSDKTIKCSNGSSIADKSITEDIKDYRASMEESKGQGGGIIKIISGCLGNNTRMSIAWKKLQANSTEVKDYKDGNKSMSTDGSACMANPICGSNETQQRTMELVVAETAEADGGVEHYIQSFVTFKDNGFSHTVKLTSENTYKLLGGSSCEIPCVIVCKRLIVCGVFLVIAIIVGLWLLLFMILRPKRKEQLQKAENPTKEVKEQILELRENNTKDKRSTSTSEIILHTFSAVLWIVVASLFICMVILCNCEDACDCDCCVELPLGIVFGILFLIHLVFWFVLLYVLYNRTGKRDNEGDIHFKTKLEKVRIIFSTIPLVGLFPVCGWLIRIYRCEKCTIHEVQLPTVERDPQLHPETILNLANLKTEETGKQNSSIEIKELKREQDTIHNSTKRKMKADSKVKVNKQKSRKEKSAFTNSGTNQLSQKNGNVTTSSQEHNAEHKKKVSDSQNIVSYSEETSRRNMDVTEMKTGSKNNTCSKDDVKHENKKSRKSEDENKHPLNTNMVSSEAHPGTMELTETKTGSENKPGSKDDVNREKKKSRKAKDENKNPINTNMVRAEAHTWNIAVTTTGSEDKLGSSDNNLSNSSMSGKALPRRKESRKENDDNKNPENTKPGSADSHKGSETMKRALSANFHDEEDATTTVSVDSSTNM